MAPANPRRVALEVLRRIDEEGAYANLVLGPALERSDLDVRDRSFVTELVYGVTRMRRALDFLVDRFVLRELDPPTRAVLRLGAYQLQFLRTPSHAAVSATVDLAPRKTKGIVNALLRKVADAPVTWPDEATRLSYPNWILDRLTVDLGRDDALGALASMDERATVTTRADGYIQDQASQWVVEAVEAKAGERVADLCAAPGGKATALAAAGATVVAADVSPARSGLVAGNARTLGVTLGVVTADARRTPLRPAMFDRVLVDAPCSGLGVLRRRADARWRVEAASVERLAALQREILEEGIRLLRPKGTLTYSVCTLTSAETLEIDRWLADVHPVLQPLPALGAPWRGHGRGALLLPQAASTDGMYLLRLYADGDPRDGR
jgi:16S rRNA (cytosine967-C5)-methyltransferase